MTVNPSTMRLGIASILIGLVGAYGVRVMMDEEEAPPPAAEAEKALVPLASQDLPAGRTLRRGDISFYPMDADEMKERSYPLELVMMEPSQIVGRRLRKPLRQGDPFLTTEVYLEGQGPTYELKAGYRAIPIQVSVLHGGSADASDVVDVFFTSASRRYNERTGERAIPQKTIAVLDAVEILEVHRPQVTALQAVVGYRAKDPTFLLQVLPDQAAKVTALKGHGHFSMMIRPPNDLSLPQGERQPYTLEGLLGLNVEKEPPRRPPYWTTEYVRRGSFSARHFPVRIVPPQQPPGAEAQGDQAADASPLDRRSPAARRPSPQRPGGQGSRPLLDPGDSPPPSARSPQVPYRSSGAGAPTPAGAPAAASPDPAPRPQPQPATSRPTPAGDDEATNPFADDEILP